MKRKLINMVMMFIIPAMASAEFFIDVYGGQASTSSGSFTTEQRRQGIPVYYSKDELDGAESAIVGLRGGYWFKNANWLGVALDISYFEADAKYSSMVVEVVPMSVLLMLRYPMLVSEDFPNGRFHPYAGAGLTFAAVDVTSQYGDFYSSNDDDDDDPGDGYGTDFRAGMDWQFTRTVGLFMEYRYTSLHFEQTRERSTGDLFTQRYYSVDYDGDLKTHFILGGITFHF